MVKFQIMGDWATGYWWRLKAANGEIVCHSEKYRTKQACRDSIDWTRRNAPGAGEEDAAA